MLRLKHESGKMKGFFLQFHIVYGSPFEFSFINKRTRLEKALTLT
jgi:hypothetical protein